MHGVFGRVWSARQFAASVARASAARMPVTLQRNKAHSTIRVACYNQKRSQAAVSATAAGKQRKVVTPTPRPLLGAEDAFYAESAGSFGDLGIIETVAQSLKAAGFVKPSRVQELAVPHIISGRDVVLAAETGSGKTLAYVAPIASLLLQRAIKAAETAQAAVPDATNSKHHPKQIALILCPNSALCQQIIRLVHSLTSPADGRPLLKACQVSSSSSPPFDPPDIVVTTPGALVTLFNDRGANYGPQWTAEGVSSRAVFVVVDEADLLSQGGYEKDLTRLLDAFKAGERRVIESQVMAELNITEQQFSRLPRPVKQACWEAGVPGMIKAGYRVNSSKSGQEQQQHGEDNSSSSSSRDGIEQQQQQQEQSKHEASISIQQQQQQYGPYLKRQYLFVAATMPVMTKADVGTELQKRFKNAVWVSGELLHQVKPHVNHTWVRSSSDDGVNESLVSAIRGDPDYQAGRARVLVFTRNTRNADEYSEFLAQQGIPNMVYHKDVPKDDRDAALAAMAAVAAASDSGSSSGNVVMVSTDAASRGIDLPNITHVIQADFAMTAIEFLHRVGRTARAGKDGKVTSFYGRSERVLAEAIKQYVEEGQPIEECFSRNRSFSNKVKKYGKFVPRGQAGPEKRQQQQQYQ